MLIQRHRRCRRICCRETSISKYLLTNPLLPAACIVATFRFFARFRRRFQRLGSSLLRFRTGPKAGQQRIFRAFTAIAIRARTTRRCVRGGVQRACSHRRRSARKREGARCNWSSSSSRRRRWRVWRGDHPREARAVGPARGSRRSRKPVRQCPIAAVPSNADAPDPPHATRCRATVE